MDRRAGLGPAAAGDRVWRRCGSGVAGQVLAGQVWVAGQVRMAARLGWGWRRRHAASGCEGGVGRRVLRQARGFAPEDSVSRKYFARQQAVTSDSYTLHQREPTRWLGAW